MTVTRLKALSIRQPWAWAILHAGKDVENRTWNTSYRGPLLVHAAGTLQPDVHLPAWCAQPVAGALVHRAIIGVVDLVDVVKSSPSPWFEGPYGLVLANPRAFAKPVTCAGAPGIWQPDDELLAKLPGL